MQGKVERYHQRHIYDRHRVTKVKVTAHINRICAIIYQFFSSSEFYLFSSGSHRVRAHAHTEIPWSG